MKKYSIIYADPPWAYRTYSKKGQGRSAESHYPTMCMSPTPKMQTYSGHVAYVRDSPGSTTTYRKKIRAYRLTALYHALLTIGPYYPAAGLAP